MSLERTFLGVDYGSRRTAMAVIGAGEPRVWVDRYGNDWDDFAVLREAHDRLAQIARAFDPLVIAIESPIVGASRNAQTAVKMSMMAGALAAAAGRGSSGIVLVPPATWKHRVVGRGNARKPDVAEWLRTEHPALHAACSPSGSDKVDQDLVDSFCLALHARAVVGEPG